MPSGYSPSTATYPANVSIPVAGEKRKNSVLAVPSQNLADRLAYLKRCLPITKQSAVGGWTATNGTSADQYSASYVCDFTGCVIDDKIHVRATAQSSANAGSAFEVFLLAIDDASGTPVQTRLVGGSAPSWVHNFPAADLYEESLSGLWTVAKAGTTRVTLGVNTHSTTTVTLANLSILATLYSKL